MGQPEEGMTTMGESGLARRADVAGLEPTRIASGASPVPEGRPVAHLSFSPSHSASISTRPGSTFGEFTYRPAGRFAVGRVKMGTSQDTGAGRRHSGPSTQSPAPGQAFGQGQGSKEATQGRGSTCKSRPRSKRDTRHTSTTTAELRGVRSFAEGGRLDSSTPVARGDRAAVVAPPRARRERSHGREPRAGHDGLRPFNRSAPLALGIGPSQGNGGN